MNYQNQFSLSRPVTSSDVGCARDDGTSQICPKNLPQGTSRHLCIIDLKKQLNDSLKRVSSAGKFELNLHGLGGAIIVGEMQNK